ncbi:MAG: NAD(P)H-hydrate dehydratase, partial [Burkholderiaceae bacterium]
INPTGNAALASAGTGDVLAGWLGGRWAGWPMATGFEAAVRAAWQHGAAAPAAATGPLRASELIEAMAGWATAAAPTQPR